MALRQTKKISELPALTPATLDTTFVVGISGSTTYKISINQLTSSLDSAFATDLVTTALSGTLDGKLSTSSFNSYTASISTASLVTSISNLNTFTASVTTASIVTSISNLNTFTASVSTASLVTSIDNLNTFTASQSTSSLVNRLNAIESVSGSWITESETGSFLTSLSGAISSSTQISDLGFVTGSYTTINSFNNLTQSFNTISQSFTTISGSFDSIDFSGINAVTESYLLFTQSYYSASASFDSRVDGLEFKDTTLATTGSNTFIGNQTISGSVYLQNGESILSADKFDSPAGDLTLRAGDSVTSDAGDLTVRAGDTVTGIGGNLIISAGDTTTGNAGTLNISSGETVTGNGGNFTINAGQTISGDGGDVSINAGQTATGAGGAVSIKAGDTVTGDGGHIILTTGDSVNGNPGDITLRIVSASVNKDWVFGSASVIFPDGTTQLTAFTGIPQGTVSSSQQITAFGFVSGSYETTGRGIISSSANLVTTSSFNSYTASISTASLVTSISNLNSATSSYLTSLSGAISSSSQLTSSYDTRYVISGSVGATPLGTISGSAQITAFGFISSSQTINTASLATTGSNTFIGTETISGSLLLSGSFSYNGTPLQNGFAFAQPILSKIVSNASYTGAAAWTGTYVSNGGAIIVRADVTGYRASVGTGTAVLYRDGVAVASHSFFFNQSSVHTTIPTITYVSNSETGSHTYSIGFTDIYADVNDYLTITVLEYGNSAILPATLISGSSQLTSSFDTRYALSGSAPTLFLLEAYASETYTLPGGYTADTCRYSVVSNTVNVSSAWFNTSTYRFTPLKAGYWDIGASYDVYRNGEAAIVIQKNGSNVATVGSISAVNQSVRKIVYLNGSTDYITIINAGANSNSRSQDINKSWFQAKWIGQ